MASTKFDLTGQDFKSRETLEEYVKTYINRDTILLTPEQAKQCQVSEGMLIGEYVVLISKGK